MTEKALREIAAIYGITVETVAGESDQAEIEEYLVALLQGANLPITVAADAVTLLPQLQEQRLQQMIDPVRVIEETEKTLTLPVQLFQGDDRQYRWTLTAENGAQYQGSFQQNDLAPLSQTAVNGRIYAVHTLDLGLTLPPGYHEFIVQAAEQGEGDQSPATQLLIVVPRQCYVPPGLSGDNRIWGLSTHVHAVKSMENWGIGDFSDVLKILGISAEAGAGTLHVAPLTCCVPQHPVRQKSPNPYRPSCRSQLNVLFIDVQAIADFVECDGVGGSMQQTEFHARLAMIRDRDRIDYAEISTIKDQLLRRLWEHFNANHLHPKTSRGSEFRSFQEKGGETLRHFALFSALHEKFAADDQYAAGWTSWPAAFRECHSPEVAEFVEQNEYEIEYYQYLQWQAELQLAAIGRRSMELGLKVGLLGEFPFAVDKNGFESWRYKEALLEGALVTRQPLDGPGQDPAVGLPLFLPHCLQNNRYRPFIEGLRQSMRYFGALTINSIANYYRTFCSFAALDEKFRSVVSFPFADMLGIITLESQRNRCLVIVDTMDVLPGEQQQQLRQKNIFSSKCLLTAKNEQGEWLGAPDYTAHAVLRSSAPFLVTATGFWKSSDIALLAKEHLFIGDREKEKAMVTRAADRVHLLITLDHEGLLPDGCTVEQSISTELDQSLLAGLQIFLARTPAKILLVAINDLLGLDIQAEPPALSCQRFWETTYPLDIEEILGGQEIASLFKALCRERGVGNVRPLGSISDRKKRQGQVLPRAFYRLQLHKDFTFQQAAAITPYLSQLGISHCYVSPFLMARPGSSHGYDIIDHSTINPEIGSREDFDGFLAVVEEQGMALILDIVPNHMGIGSDNQWWMDVLENGEASKYARFFDINWLPQQPELAGRLLLPVLGDYYGKILEDGQLTLCFDDTSGSFSVRYYDHRFPVSPRSCPRLLGYDLQRLEKRLGEAHHSFQEFQNLIHALANLPGHRKTSLEMLQVRHRDKEVSKRTLVRLCRKSSEIREFIEENVILFNGVSGKPESFDLLHTLLEEQPYRLAFWRVAADEINYRRFFDINELAALRMEEIEVFHETHRLILDLIATGRLDGLRIDHPDGLYDPYEYFCRLQTFAAGESEEDSSRCGDASDDLASVPLYVVVEKILAGFESLPDNWPISGTTGYDFSNLLNGLFVNAAAEKKMTAIYHRFIGGKIEYDQLLYDSKKLIIRSSMAGELNVLASLLYRLAQTDRRTRDLTFNSLRDGLIEVVCFFPVYRTYTSQDKIADRDAQFIKWALAKAQLRQHLDDANVFGFIRSVLLLETEENAARKSGCLDFVMKFQQYTGPVMAKGLEDTFFYRYNRLLSLNEVGGSPRSFGVSLAAFHQTNQSRLRHWPHSMLNSSTHDSKRSEDVRARINVLTEMTTEWQKRIKRWSIQNRSHKTTLEENPAPSENDEYAFYQNLLGAWPLEPLNEEGRKDFTERMKNMLLKTSREAKMHTSWTNPNILYENALIRFVEGSLGVSNNPFQNDFLSFQEDIAWFGMLNSLSQVFLKLVAPGIPDIYQGNETWRFCLVDPDNRRPVDFARRQSMLFSLLERMHSESAQPETLQQELLADMSDGRAKMYVIAQTLRLRRDRHDLFTDGSYLPLEVTGSRSHHICAFARKKNDQVMVAVAPRLYVTLMQGKRELPLADSVWHDTTVQLPEDLVGMQLHNIFSDEPEPLIEADNRPPSIKVGRLLQSWPVALLQGTVL
ncbi:malto-oligosyltrehalose synthase [Desulfocastanea catecholica]